LNPSNTASEERAIRKSLFQARLKEASGGEGAYILGLQTGSAAGLLTYSYL